MENVASFGRFRRSELVGRIRWTSAGSVSAAESGLACEKSGLGNSAERRRFVRRELCARAGRRRGLTHVVPVRLAPLRSAWRQRAGRRRSGVVPPVAPAGPLSTRSDSILDTRWMSYCVAAASSIEISFRTEAAAVRWPSTVGARRLPCASPRPV